MTTPLNLSDPSLQRQQNFINARWCDAIEGRQLEVADPASDTVFAQVPDSGAADALAAVDAAHAAFPTWRAKPAKERAQLLKRWHALILQHQDDLARTGEAAGRG